MKNLRILMLSAAFVAAIFSSTEAQVRFGIKAGLNVANAPSSDDYDDAFEATIGAKYEPQALLSFHIGAQAEFGLGGNIGLGVGLQLSGKGTRYEFESVLQGVPYSAKAYERPLYLQVPLALIYRKNGFYAGVGPYAGFGVGGNLKVKVKVQGQSESDTQDIKFGNSNEDYYAPIDFGAGFELGYEFGPVRLSASYQLGLSNTIPKDQVDAGKDAGLDQKKKNNVIGISAAYFFQKR